MFIKSLSLKLYSRLDQNLITIAINTQLITKLNSTFKIKNRHNTIIIMSSSSSSSGSPCGACKFLRRKCAKGCVFAPYFCHEQGASHFAAIHKVFGASNASKLLSHLPISDRCEAAITISYEAQARLQDPIYGCVSHIFALQQQVPFKTLIMILSQNYIYLHIYIFIH